MKRQREDPNYEGLTMFEALIMYQVERSGGTSAYAAKLGVNSATLWRWLERESDPIHGHTTPAKERLINDLGIPRDDLQRLAEITVSQGCEIILGQLYSPDNFPAS